MSQVLSATMECRGIGLNYLSELLNRKDYGEAIRYFESLESQWKNLSDRESGIIMHLGAKAYFSFGDFPRALTIIRTAIAVVSRSTGENTELGECYLLLGDILREMGKFGEAEKAFRDAESIFRRADNTSKSGDALNRLAGILFRTGDMETSLKCLLEAVESARKGNEKRKLGYLFGNIGRVYTMLGKLNAAEENICFNIEFSSGFDDQLELARANLSLAYVYIQQYRFEDAEMTLAKALDYIRRNNLKKEEVIYLTYAGELAVKSKQYHEADELLNKAATLGRNMAPESLLAARPVRHLAELALRQDNYRKAQSLACRIMPVMKNLNETVEIGALYRIQAVCYERMNSPEKAREAFLQAADILEEHKSKFELADCLTAMGQSRLFNYNRRIIYLCRAEELYNYCRIKFRAAEIQGLISRLDRDAVPDRNNSVSTGPVGTGFSTKNAAMAKIISQLHLLKKSDLPILITGETGTGKDFLSKYFHSLARPDGPYVAVNCAAVPENLIESELFGYQKGAFTGAESNKRGLFLAANNGVLLLDEIGELPLMLQAKLLNVLETKKLRPLGTADEIELDLMVVAATNRDLYEMVKEGQFRLDLYYRLAGITIEIPPLRMRKEDIPCLMELFMKRSGMLRGEEKPDPELVKMFVAYDWPGNIRQLENEVKQLAALSSLAESGSLTELSRTFFNGKSEESSNSLFEQVEALEKRLLLEALAVTGGNKSEAAKMLLIHESTLRAKMKRYGIINMYN